MARGFCFVAGVDEAGRGCLAGPVVAAAVVFPPDYCNDSLRDSKKLSPRQRDELSIVIKNSSLATGVGVVSADVIDTINILRAALLAMKEAVAALEIAPDFVIVDGNNLLELPLAQKAVVGGDGLSVSCAAASIIAKTTRDALMEDYHQRFPAYDFLSNKGYGTARHIAAIARWGLSPIHRKTFHPKALARQREETLSK